MQYKKTNTGEYATERCSVCDGEGVEHDFYYCYEWQCHNCLGNGRQKVLIFETPEELNIYERPIKLAGTIYFGFWALVIITVILYATTNLYIFSLASIPVFVVSLIYLIIQAENKKESILPSLN